MSIVAAWILCVSPIVTDGDTFRCAGMSQSVRIAGIDAPDRRCSRGRDCRTTLDNGTTYDDATSRLRAIMRMGAPVMRFYAGSTYGRRIAVVCIGRRNVGAEMIARGSARYMQRWNGGGVRVRCPG